MSETSERYAIDGQGVELHTGAESPEQAYRRGYQAGWRAALAAISQRMWAWRDRVVGEAQRRGAPAPEWSPAAEEVGLQVEAAAAFAAIDLDVWRRMDASRRPPPPPYRPRAFEELET